MSEPSPSKGLHYGLWAVQLLLAFAFGMAGGMKLITPLADMAANGMTIAERLPEGLIRFIGLSEVLGAIGLIAPAATGILPKLTPTAAAALALVMVLGVGEHAMNGEFDAFVAPIVLGGLSAFVAFGRFRLAPTQPRG